MKTNVVSRLAAAGTTALDCGKFQAAVPAAAKHQRLFHTTINVKPMTTAVHLPTFQSQLAQIADAERRGGWLSVCVDAGRYLLLNRQFVEALAACLSALPEEPNIEVCAGGGELAVALGEYGVCVTATDADPPAGSPVLHSSAQEALVRYRPAVVLGSFTPIDTNVDKAVLSCPTVRHYLVLGVRLGGEFGSAALWRTPGWRRQALPEVARWMLTRHDVWTGLTGRPILQHGEAWCFSRECNPSPLLRKER
ncbi:MAG: hypothetical protein JXB10_01875 [Pirellulales bacterium]|nr:hypothetical protein [Pirellulales bacterium]